MQKIGVSLVQDGVEKRRIFGAFPEPYILENGDAVHGLTEGAPFQEGVLLPCFLIDAPPEWCSKTGETVEVQADKVVVTNLYASSPDIVPPSVSMRQARLALLQAGKLDAVNAVVAAADPATQLSWEYSATVERANPIIAALAEGLGMTSADLDNLFRAASAL